MKIPARFPFHLPAPLSRVTPKQALIAGGVALGAGLLYLRFRASENAAIAKQGLLLDEARIAAQRAQLASQLQKMEPLLRMDLRAGDRLALVNGGMDWVVDGSPGAVPMYSQELAAVSAYPLGVQVQRAWITWNDIKTVSSRIPRNAGPPPPPPPAAPPAVVAPRLISTLAVRPGPTYYATVKAHGGAALAGEQQVINAGAHKGFVNIRASKSKPAGWPGTAPGDWYITANYAGAPQTLPRHEGTIFANVDVTEAYEA